MLTDENIYNKVKPILILLNLKKVRKTPDVENTK